MGRIESARIAVLAWSRAVMSLRARVDYTPRVGHDGDADDSGFADTVVGDTGLIMNPAQAPGFFARSASWRCMGCGKVHFFGQMVPVATASPCSCAGIEFEPQRDLAFATPTFAGRAQLTG